MKRQNSGLVIPGLVILVALGSAVVLDQAGFSSDSGGGGREPVRALFVGNSYTAGQGGLADLVDRMAGAQGLSAETAQVTAGGYTLEAHWSNAIGTRDRIAEGWDWVVLQEQSLRPITDPELFFTYARLLDAEIREAGARTMFFLTWSRENTPETQATLNESYCSIAEELSAAVAPVGPAWALSRERQPTTQLYGPDGSHQGTLGQYLLGMVFHQRLWHRSPKGLPHDVSPSLSVTEEQAAFFQQVAVDTQPCGTLFHDGFEAGDTGAWYLGLAPALPPWDSPRADPPGLPPLRLYRSGP